MKKESTQQTQLLIELPSMHAHIVTKRGRLLRDGGSRGVSTLLKSKDKSWLATTIERNTNANGWNAAHEVAAKLKREFGRSVYVEPDGEGRFRELTNPNAAKADDNAFGSSGDFGLTGAAGMNDRGASPFGGAMSPFGVSDLGSGSDPFGGIGGFGVRGNRNSSDPFAAHMPHIPSAADFMPKHVADMMGLGANKESGGGSKKKSLKFAALHTAYGWSELAEPTQMMFEVEAAQLMNNGFQSQVGLEVVDDYSALVVLALQPAISHALRNFIDKGTASGAPSTAPTPFMPPMSPAVALAVARQPELACA